MTTMIEGVIYHQERVFVHQATAVRICERAYRQSATRHTITPHLYVHEVQ